ncbi:uncharacterized protein [Procambarus clarkii]|uniref:uncharacterized protein n=1 Tax=Procambarus clarkii TaxID=6728 RepID=UPI0037447505
MGSALGASSAASQGPVSTTGQCTCMDPPRLASFFSTSLRPRLAPELSPSRSVGATTPNCGELSAGERTGGISYVQPLSTADTWTSATTSDVEREAPGTATSLPEAPPAPKSFTTAQAVVERLGTGRTSSLPEADPEPRASQTVRTDARHSTAAASTTGGTGPHTTGCSAAPPAPSTAVTPGEGSGPGAAARDEEDVDDSQRPSGRPS